MDDFKLPQIHDDGGQGSEDVNMLMSLSARASTAPVSGSPIRGKLTTRGTMATYKIKAKKPQWEKARPVRPGGPGGKKMESRSISHGVCDIELNVLAMEKLMTGEFDLNQSHSSGMMDHSILLKQQNMALKRKCAEQADLLASVITELRLERQLASQRANELGKYGEQISRSESEMQEASVSLQGKETQLAQLKKKLTRARREIASYQEDFTAMKMEKADILSKHALEMREMKATNEELQQVIEAQKVINVGSKKESQSAIEEVRDALARAQASQAILTRKLVEVEEARATDKAAVARALEEKLLNSIKRNKRRETAEKAAIDQVPEEDHRMMIAELEADFEELRAQYYEMEEAKNAAHQNFLSVSRENLKLSQELRCLLSLFNSRFSSLLIDQGESSLHLAQKSDVTVLRKPSAPAQKKKGASRKNNGRAGKARASTLKPSSDAEMFQNLLERSGGGGIPLNMTELQAMVFTQSRLIVEMNAEKEILTRQLQQSNGQEPLIPPSPSDSSATTFSQNDIVFDDDWSLGINIKQIHEGRQDGRLLDGVSKGDHWIYFFSIADRGQTIEINAVDMGQSRGQRTVLSLTDDDIISLFPGHHAILESRGHSLAMSIAQRLVYKPTPVPSLALTTKASASDKSKVFQLTIQRCDTFRRDPVNNVTNKTTRKKKSLVQPKTTELMHESVREDVDDMEEGKTTTSVWEDVVDMEDSPHEENSAVKLQAVVRGRQSRASQASIREGVVEREGPHEEESAAKLQALARGRQSRRAQASSRSDGVLEVEATAERERRQIRKGGFKLGCETVVLGSVWLYVDNGDWLVTVYEPESGESHEIGCSKEETRRFMPDGGGFVYDGQDEKNEERIDKVCDAVLEQLCLEKVDNSSAYYCLAWKIRHVEGEAPATLCQELPNDSNSAENGNGLQLIKKGAQKIGDNYAFISMFFEEVPRQDYCFIFRLVEKGSISKDSLEVRVPLVDIAGSKCAHFALFVLL
jgi:hypothetical protein